MGCYVCDILESETENLIPIVEKLIKKKIESIEPNCDHICEWFRADDPMSSDEIISVKFTAKIKFKDRSEEITKFKIGFGNIKWFKKSKIENMEAI